MAFSCMVPAGTTGRLQAQRRTATLRAAAKVRMPTAVRSRQSVAPRADAAARGAEAAVVADAPASLLKEIDSTTYQSFLEDAGDGVAVVKWTGKTCGPCKVMLPRVEAMAKEFSTAAFAKIWTNATNKDLGKELGIRAAPTFLVYKAGQKVAEITGTKDDELRAAIESHI